MSEAKPSTKKGREDSRPRKAVSNITPAAEKWRTHDQVEVANEDGTLATRARPRASAELRQMIVESGPACAVSFSTGKDAIAATLAMKESGADVRLFHLYLVPGLRIVEESIAYFEAKFATKIAMLPHPSIYRMLHEQVFRAPEQRLAVESSRLWDLDWTAEDTGIAARIELQLEPDAWIGDGVRSADSPYSRAYVMRSGGVNFKRRKACVVHDWNAEDVTAAIKRNDVRLPIDYRLFGRSFDGIDARFTMALRDGGYRDDYERLLEVFPLLEADVYRHEKGWV